MSKKKNNGLPRDATPDFHKFSGIPDSCFDLVNQYGTYNIQPTADTDNLFPLIAPGLPHAWDTLHLGKADLEREGNSPS